MSQRQYQTRADSDSDEDSPVEALYAEQLLAVAGLRGGGEDSSVRAAQFLRGTLSTKVVASPEAIRSLKSVDINDCDEKRTPPGPMLIPKASC